MSHTWMLIGVAVFVALPIELSAQPFTAVVGDKKVTSLTRSSTKGLGMSRQDLIKAARDAVPINIAPTDPPSRDKGR